MLTAHVNYIQKPVLIPMSFHSLSVPMQLQIVVVNGIGHTYNGC